MNVIFIVPTGLGAPIGGHAGDATPAARLIASACDTLIVHPNVVNASDINEMPHNALYVTGSTIDDLLEGRIGLARVRSNRIAVLVNQPIPNVLVNLVSAVRASAGIDAFIVGLPKELKMTAFYRRDGSATGHIEGAQEAIEHLDGLDETYEAVAILTKIEVTTEMFHDYLEKVDVNPWGGVEAKLTRIMTNGLQVPCAHAPYGHTVADYNEIVEPRLAAEMISETYGFCVMKGLHKAPRIVQPNEGLNATDIDVLITPEGCYGVPHVECVRLGIPIIAVRENTVSVRSSTQYPRIVAANYLEAAGMVLALRRGILLESLIRPIPETQVYEP